MRTPGRGRQEQMGQYVTTTTEQPVYVSGKFAFDFALASLLRPPPPLDPPVAIEILREFGPQEFIGRVHVQRGTEWVPVSPEAARSYWWFTGKEIHFEMGGAGQWEVEWFRFESSTRYPNPYLAVALRQKSSEASQKPSAIPGT